MVRILATRLIHCAETMRPRAAKRMLFALRMLPAALGLFVVTALCIPSYLWLEPAEIAEEIAPACLIGAGLAVALCLAACTNALRAVVRCRRFIRGLRAARLGSPIAAWVIDSPEPLLAIAGIVRPRLLVTGSLLEMLSPGQLAVA